VTAPYDCCTWNQLFCEVWKDLLDASRLISKPWVLALGSAGQQGTFAVVEGRRAVVEGRRAVVVGGVLGCAVAEMSRFVQTCPGFQTCPVAPGSVR
jgi:hypothetical protein